MLYQHQQAGVEWLLSRPNGRGYLGDVPGTGKTRTLAAAVQSMRSGATRPLVICPAIVRTHWRREIALLTGSQVDERFIKSYDEIVRGGNALLKQLVGVDKVDTLILDEAHFLKHAGSKRTQILLGRDGYAPRMPRVYAASGTPVPKNAYEFGTVLLSLFPEVALEHGLKTLADVKDRFCIVQGGMVRGAWKEKIFATVKEPEEFKAILGKVMLRRTLDDVGLDVPELDWQVTLIDGGSRHDATRPPADGEFGAPAILGREPWFDDLWRRVQNGDSLEEIANDPHVARMRRRLGELKVAPVVKMLREQLADGDEKIVIFAHHTSVLQGLHVGLADYGAAYIDGGTSQMSRDAAIHNFVSQPDCRVFIGQNIACGTGMDGLQHSGARRAILVEPDWSAYMNEQLGKRLARNGQSAGRCIAQMVALAGTLDEAIVGQNLKEVRMADSIGLGAH